MERQGQSQKRALINVIEDGGLKMIHSESLVHAQKLTFFKRYADPDFAADWKLVLDSLLKPVGGTYLLKCNFSFGDIPIKVSPFYS